MGKRSAGRSIPLLHCFDFCFGVVVERRGLGLAASCGYLPAMKTLRLIISGEVQGVGYRAWAVRIAAGLGLRGWVRNRMDGTVEMLTTGLDEDIAAMIEAAHRGPRAARVSEVQIMDAEDDGSGGFVAHPTA
jgi:acylphosphatase